jgi:sporulation protein YlmC with PRC-barrel domain
MNDFLKAFNDTPAEESTGFSLLPEGTYTATLGDCKLDMTKEPMQLSFVYDITEGEFRGRKLFSNYRLEGRGLGFLKKDLKQLSIDYSNVAKVEDLAAIVWERLPMKCEVYVNQKEYNGKVYNNTYLNALLTGSPITAPAAASAKPKNHAPQTTARKGPPSEIPF